MQILSWNLSSWLNTEFWLDALEMALEGSRKPEALHSYQFTSSGFVARLHAEKIKINWTGGKRYYDNILVELLGRSFK